MGQTPNWQKCAISSNWHGSCKTSGISGMVRGDERKNAMTRFDTRFAGSYVAALAIAVWSTTMLFAATAVPSVAAVGSLA
jgi:hypothetical protein